MKKLFIFVCMVSIFWNVNLSGRELAESLPTKTLVYAYTDVKAVLEKMENYLKFVDPERAESILVQTKNIFEVVKELAAAHEFSPKLMDDIWTSRIHFVVMHKDKPIEIATKKIEYGVSLVVDTREETAVNFIKEVKGLMDRQKEKHPDREDQYGWKEIEMEKGELISSLDGTTTLGYMGGRLIFSFGKPDELWGALIEPAEPNLADTEPYQRYVQTRQHSMGYGLVNLAELYKLLDDYIMKQAGAKAAKNNQDLFPDGSEPEAGNADVEDPGVKIFKLVTTILSLDKLKSLDFNFLFSVEKEVVKGSSSMKLFLAQPISKVLQGLLNGGSAFRLPKMGKREGMAVMVRVALKEIFDEIIRSLDQKAAMGYAQYMGMMKMMVGNDVNDFVQHFAGDFYLFVDVEKQELEIPRWDEEKKVMVMEKKVMPMPRGMMLMGVNDPEATSQFLSKLFTAASTNLPGGGQLVKKRTYQETDVYVAGKDAGKEGSDPNGLTTFAIVVVDRYISFGSWKDVTRLIREAKAADQGANKTLEDIIQKHTNSNLIMTVHKAFSKKFEEMTKENDDADPFQIFLKQLEKQKLPFEDDELETRFKTAVKRLLEDFKFIGEKVQEMSPEIVVVHGTHAGDLYRVESETEIRKNTP